MEPEPTEVRDEDLHALAIIQVALGTGPVLLWAAVAFLAQASPAAAGLPEAGGAALEPIVLLSAVHAFMAPTQWVLGTVLYQRALTRGETGSFMARLRGATLLRLAMFEAPALLGAVVGLIAVQTGVAGEAPWVWANAASTLMLLGLVVTTLPTRERAERIARDVQRGVP